MDNKVMLKHWRSGFVFVVVATTLISCSADENTSEQMPEITAEQIQENTTEQVQAPDPESAQVNLFVELSLIHI